jgi:lysophospholipase L1-like esterase
VPAPGLSALPPTSAASQPPITPVQVPNAQTATIPQTAASRAATSIDAQRVAQGEALFGERLAVTPASLTFTSRTPQTLTVTVRHTTIVYAASADPNAAGVSPDHVVVTSLTNGTGTATFTVTPLKNLKKGAIGLIDSQFEFAIVPVTVTFPTPVVYTAIGASDAVGYGASVPCTTATPPEGPADPGCLNLTGTGYVPDLAKLFIKAGTRVTLDDLGYSGAVLGPDILAEVNQYGSIGNPDACEPRSAADAYPEDFITYELPQVQSNTTLVTIFAGGNDTNGLVNALGCGAGGSTATSQQSFITTWITNFGNDLHQLLVGIKRKAPNAKIIIANLPNFSQIPVGLAVAAKDPAAGQALAAISLGFDLNVINKVTSSGIPVADLLCDSASYNSSNFYTDGFHPNDSGYAAFAALLYADLTTSSPPDPSSKCSYATLTSVMRAPLMHPVQLYTPAVKP